MRGYHLLHHLCLRATLDSWRGGETTTFIFSTALNVALPLPPRAHFAVHRRAGWALASKRHKAKEKRWASVLEHYHSMVAGAFRRAGRTLRSTYAAE